MTPDPEARYCDVRPDEALIVAPYDLPLSRALAARGFRWDPDDRCWRRPMRTEADEELVLEVCRYHGIEVY